VRSRWINYCVLLVKQVRQYFGSLVAAEAIERIRRDGAVVD